MTVKIRFLSLITAILMLISLFGCSADIPPEETTEESETQSETVATTAPESEETTQTPETDLEFPVYDGPSSEFKFTAEDVVPGISYADYTDFLSLSEKSHLVPALAQQMIPQGMDIWQERGWLLISGYFPDTKVSECSVIVAVDMASGAYVGEYYLTNTDGTPHASHAGGLAVTKKNIFIANGSNLYRIPLTEIMNAGQCGKITIAEAILTPTRASFCNYSGGYLWVGDFQYSTSYTTDEYRHMENNEGKMYYAWSVGYELTEETESEFKPEALVKDSYATPDVIISITERIQGFAVNGRKIILSQSYGRANKSTLFIYKNPIGGMPHEKVELNGKTVSVYFLDSKLPCKKVTAPPMSEGLASLGGDVYVLFESGANKYAGGGGKDPTAHVWKMKIEQ